MGGNVPLEGLLAITSLLENGKMTAICKSLREDISSVCESMITLTEKSNSDYLEVQSNRNNMVVDGIAESPRDLDGD